MSSPAKMFSSVQAETILKSPLNTSKSKYQWSFSKSQRFPNSKLYCHQIYDIPTTRSKRKTSFGLGKKTDLDYGKHPHNVTPSPNTYNLFTFIQNNEMHKKGPTNRVGREETKPLSYITLSSQKVPGPGRYTPAKSTDAPSWSMRAKVADDIFPKTTQKIVPGPGHYDSSENLNKSGKYFTSKHPNSKSKMWNPKQSQRFSRSQNNIPGPGWYSPKNDLSNEGGYVLSKNISTGKRIIPKSVRESFVDEKPKRVKTPGPGTYRPPSDFGHYENSDKLYSSTMMHATKTHHKFVQ